MFRKNNLFLKFLVLLIIMLAGFLFSFTPISKAESVILYQEDFNDNIADNWQEYYRTIEAVWHEDPIPGIVWNVSGGKYNLDVEGWELGAKSVYQGPSQNIPSWGDFVFSFDAELKDGVDRIIYFRMQDDGNKYFLGLRAFWKCSPRDTPVIYLAKCHNGVCEGNQYEKYFAFYRFDNDNKDALNGEIAHIDIEAFGNRIRIFYNHQLVIDWQETTENYPKSGTIGFYGWSGHDTAVNVSWDNIVVRTDWPEEPTGLDPVIIVPGIMGSWNMGGTWELDPILHTYDNLWEALKLAGYKDNPEEPEDQTLFAFPYQWRDSNVISAGRLKDKINNVKDICDCEKVDIVAHSMGGLVVRRYIVSGDYENDIDQVVFLGVPHKGSPKAYLMWEAVEPMGYQEKIAIKYFSIEAYLMGYGLGHDSLFNYIQNKVKSVEQLLPVYPYLQDTGSISLRHYDIDLYPDNYPYNFFLESLNSEENLNRFHNSGVRIFNIVGNNGDNTIGVLSVNFGEQYYPLWQHGYVEDDIKIAGDKTVPNMSSSLFIPTVIENTEHNQIPTNAQKQIIEYLTGQMPIIEINDTPEIEEILVVAIHSPADFVIISNKSGKKLGKDFLNNAAINEMDYGFYTGFENEPEFAVIINPEQGGYRVELQGTDSGGDYKLDLSYIDEEKEITKEFTGSIQTGEKHNFDFIYNKDDENPISELKPDDNIPPEIIINNPVENEQYLYNEELVIDYTVIDDFSGVDATIIELDGKVLDTITIDLFYYDSGEHILTVTAVDNAGNSASAEVKFEIISNMSSISSAIQNIERIYVLGWISKKYVKQVLIAKLKILQKRLDVFAKQKSNIEKLKQKISDNTKIKDKRKQKLLDKFNKRLEKLEQREYKFIEKLLDKLEKSLNKFYSKGMIDQRGYDIIIDNINYLRENL